jgi:hypothetical protein
MRGLVIGGVLLTLGLAVPAAAQDGVPPLERLIDFRTRVPVAVTDCTVPSMTEYLARRFEQAAGVEFMLSDCAKLGGGGRRAGGETVDLYGLTLQDALTKLLALDPRYRMVESDGVIVVRPVQAWADPKNVLNFGSGSFALEDATLGIALDALLSAMTGEPASPDDRYAIPTEDGARRFNVKTGAISAVGALEAIVRAHGRSTWTVRHSDIGRMISFHTFDGSSVGSSRRTLQ